MLQKFFIGAAGSESLTRVLAQVPVLTHLDLRHNKIGSRIAKKLAGVLGQCTTLTD